MKMSWILVRAIQVAWIVKEQSPRPRISQGS
jgi:hypothetical protein